MIELTSPIDPRFKFDVRTVQGLDIDAFDRWLGFKKGRRQSYKTPLSERAAAVKLSQMGDDQAEVVNEAIANNYAGFFPLKKILAAGQKPEKTNKQIAAENARFDSENSRSQEYWNKHGLRDDLGRLKLCEALLARYSVQPEEGDRMEQLRNVVVDCMQSVSSIKVLDNPSLLSMIRALWGEKGVNRLKTRAKVERGQGAERPQDVVDDMARAVHQ
jgi:hypothetical protein